MGWYDYGFRSYDAQIGRFPQLDPLTDEYPYLTPYQYAGNEPIGNIDFMGLGIETGLTASTAKTLQGVVVSGGRAAAQTTISASSSLLRAGLTIGSISAKLAAITARGSADALYNANTVGLYDAFGGNHVDEYSDFYEQEAYLNGRLGGDAIALAQMVIEQDVGTGIALSTGAETFGVGAGVGLIIGLHGTGAGAIATADIIKTNAALKELYRLNASAVAARDASSSPPTQSSGGTTANKGNAAKERGKSINQLNKAVRTGKTPKGIKRFDKGRGTKNLPQDEVHFNNGSSLYRDGTWRHDKGFKLTNDQIKFLEKNGWKIPK